MPSKVNGCLSDDMLSDASNHVEAFVLLTLLLFDLVYPVYRFEIHSTLQKCAP